MMMNQAPMATTWVMSPSMIFNSQNTAGGSPSCLLTKIQDQPLIPARPSICIRPYARMEEKPPTHAEIR
jgi:hypothetical protein